MREPLLVEAHREEFDQAIRDLTTAVPLNQRRRQNLSSAPSAPSALVRE